LFTDRNYFARLLAERLHDPPVEKVLFLHGAGGNGKSLLLRYLRKTLCKQLQPHHWQDVKDRSNAELARTLADWPLTECRTVPSVLLDFGLRLPGEVQPRDRFYGLLLLRKELGELAIGDFRFRFPRYDFACIWYLHRKGKSLDEIRALFPLGEGAGLVAAAADAASGVPVGGVLKAFLDFGIRGWSEQLTVQFAQRGVDRKTQERVRSLDLDSELLKELPGLLAEDLNAAIARPNAPKRLVLFFDTHEAFWGAQRNLPREAYYFQDEWLRRLLRKLDLKAGIVAVL